MYTFNNYPAQQAHAARKNRCDVAKFIPNNKSVIIDVNMM